MLREPKVTLQLARKMGLLKEEYDRIVEILGRTPTYTELGIFAVMWSEHCSYKNSVALLKTLPKESKNLVVKPGEENAGAIDIGDGLAVVFKIESHNHPSAVEPYQGAATGVGGIMRDVFTMGARPIASLNSLRFGDLSHPKSRYYLDGVIRGIGDYGNCFGVPTVAGEIYFEDCYLVNPLVNAMAVGIVKKENLIFARATGKDNPVLIVGSSTGRDGIHGATFASEQISAKSEAKRPSVQIGDPFTEKLLLEATLEVIKQGLVVGIQDMGAAGLTCSTSEMSARGKSGMDIDVSRVPVREERMIPYEIMLSESQERMLVVAKKGKEKEVQKIFDKWDLNSKIIGKVTDDGMLTVRNNRKIVAKIPAESLVLGGGAPVYSREKEKPKYLEKVAHFDITHFKLPGDFNQVILKMVSSPNIASKRWVYEQYDTSVRTNTVVGPGSDAAVLRIRGTKSALAMTTDGNSRYIYLEPRTGAKIAVAEAARNIVCSGGQPLGITNCLNFGDPYDKEIYWTFSEVVYGMGEACRAFEIPVTGGNVSFYNEHPKGAVYPTLVIGMVGLVEDLSYIRKQWFQNKGDIIVLLGETKTEMGGSQYQKVFLEKVAGKPPEVDLKKEKRLQKVCLEGIKRNLINSAHDCSDGGLAITLAEACFNGDKISGCKIDLKNNKQRPDVSLFSESQARIIVSVSSQNLDSLKAVCVSHNQPFEILGEVIEDKFIINDWISLPTEILADKYFNSLARRMED